MKLFIRSIVYTLVFIVTLVIFIPKEKTYNYFIKKGVTTVKFLPQRVTSLHCSYSMTTPLEISFNGTFKDGEVTAIYKVLDKSISFHYLFVKSTTSNRNLKKNLVFVKQESTKKKERFNYEYQL